MKKFFSIAFALAFSISAAETTEPEATEPTSINEYLVSGASEDVLIPKIQRLVNEGASLREQDSFGNTPLHNALLFEYEKIARYLIDRSAPLNIKNKEEQTPLDLAQEQEMDGIAAMIEARQQLPRKKRAVEERNLARELAFTGPA